jgi:pSer/pThr/pTyr-binding forkhead associated (FHA) protein
MAKLQFSLDGNSLGQFELDKERMTIGRRPTNDIHIDNLAVSGDHAAIVTIGENSFLEDLNSTNGTMVNGKPIKKHVLLHRDQIEFGKYQLTYLNDTQMAANTANGAVAEEDAGKTKLVKLANLSEATPNALASQSLVYVPAPENAASTAVDSAPVATAAVEKPVAETKVAAKAAENTVKMARLQVQNGANEGRELLLNKALTTLGKPGVQVAVITKRPNGYFITHVEGDDLPTINGQKIGTQATALSDRDVVELSGIKMEFFLA